MSSRLAIFDVDGTLCDTSAVDEACFLKTASELLSVPYPSVDWGTFQHVTDSHIVDSLWRQHLGRVPTPAEILLFIDRFEAALRRSLKRTPELFFAVPGAGSFLNFLCTQGWSIAIATGGWSRTARFKLRAAGLPVDLLRSSSDDSHDRAAIFEMARRQVESERGERFSRVVLIGDGIWDLQVAVGLGWDFLGVASEGSRNRLEREGASAIVDDFRDIRNAYELMLGRSVSTAVRVPSTT